MCFFNFNLALLMTSSSMTSPRRRCRPSYFVNSKAPVTLGPECRTQATWTQKNVPFYFFPQPIGKRMLCTLPFSFGVHLLGGNISLRARGFPLVLNDVNEIDSAR